MPREHPDYRNTIEQLNRLVPDRELLTTEEVMKITGYRRAATVQEKFAMQGGRVNKATFARMLCEYGG